VLLNRRHVIAVAMELIEADGVEGVTMSRLATELGCGLIALYSYVPSKAALLDAVAEVAVSGVEVAVEPGQAWTDQLRVLATAGRLAAQAHPRCALIAAARPQVSASARRPAEAALAALQAAGFDGRDAVAVLRALRAFVGGSLLREIGARAGLDCGPEHRPRLRPAEFPVMTALSGHLAATNPDEEFEFGLDLLMHGIAVLQPSRESS
jgi:AcrR family transcriptional regulator